MARWRSRGGADGRPGDADGQLSEKDCTAGSTCALAADSGNALSGGEQTKSHPGDIHGILLGRPASAPRSANAAPEVDRMRCRWQKIAASCGLASVVRLP